MGRETVLNGFDEQNLVILKNELQRLWDAVDSLMVDVRNIQTFSSPVEQSASEEKLNEFLLMGKG